MIKKAIALYEMMSARCLATGVAPNQAQIYAEMAEFMRNECDTIEQATQKIKNSRYYLAPSAALTKDKVLALLRAAEDDDIKGAAEVYRKKLAEIDQDPSSIHDATYLAAAHKYFIQHFERIHAFEEIHQRYLETEACFEEILLDNHHQAIRDAFNKLESYGADFVECSSQAAFREALSIDDEAYKRFVVVAVAYRTQPPALAQQYNEARERVKNMLEKLNRSQIEQNARNSRSAVGACLIVAPADEHGDYQYTELVIENQ